MNASSLNEKTRDGLVPRQAMIGLGFCAFALAAGDVAARMGYPEGAGVAAMAVGLFAFGLWTAWKAQRPARKPEARPQPEPQAPEPEPTPEPLAPWTLAPVLDGLAAAPEPLVFLRHVVEQTRTAEGRADGLFDGTGVDGTGAEAPSPLDLFLAEQLEQAGLFSLPPDLALVARLNGRSGAVQLEPVDTDAHTATAEERRCVLACEAALNRTRMAATAARPALGHDGLRALYQAVELGESSLASQAAHLSIRASGTSPTNGVTGEWNIRHALALGIETLQAPWRIEANFQVNEEAGLCALEIVAPDDVALAPLAWDASTDEPAPVGADQRAWRAARAACSETLLLTRYAAVAAPGLKEVWVSAIDSDGRCLLTGHWAVSELLALDLTGALDPVALVVGLGARLSIHEGGLAPVRPLFSMADERLSPSWRRELPETRGSIAAVPEDLAASGDRPLAAFAEAVGEALAPSALESVRAVKALAADAVARYDDPRIAAGAQAAIEGLACGTLAPEDVEAVREAVRFASPLDKAVRSAVTAMERGDAQGIVDRLARPIREADARFSDTDAVVWRSFHNSLERAAFNRERAASGDTRALRLAPGTFHAGLLGLSTAWMQLGDVEQALACALRVLELDPWDTGAQLRCARCYEALGDLPMAEATLRSLLETGWEPDTLALAYLRLGQVLQAEDDEAGALACYRRCAMTASPCAEVAEALAAQLGGELPADLAKPVEAALEERRLPCAPTDAVSGLLLDGLQETVDAGQFVAAQDFGQAVVALSGDDAVARAVASLA